MGQLCSFRNYAEGMKTNGRMALSISENYRLVELVCRGRMRGIEIDAIWQNGFCDVTKTDIEYSTN